MISTIAVLLRARAFNYITGISEQKVPAIFHGRVNQKNISRRKVLVRRRNCLLAFCPKGQRHIYIDGFYDHSLPMVNQNSRNKHLNSRTWVQDGSLKCLQRKKNMCGQKCPKTQHQCKHGLFAGTHVGMVYNWFFRIRQF